jgi:predicted RNA-binding Zn ribbon-like protein
MAKLSTITEMDLTGGAACLDFINSALEFDQPVERLHIYSDLLILTRRLGILDTNVLAALAVLAQADPNQAAAVLTRAHQVRQSMLAVFSALVKGGLEDLPAWDLNAFNEHINEALGKRGFLRQANLLTLAWQDFQPDLLQAVWVFSLSAYELLRSGDQKLIKQCGACAWYFLDTTKNHGRKWCDMQSCGSHQKARRYYQRKKQV